jgi:phosphotriesterase-related protein
MKTSKLSLTILSFLFLFNQCQRENKIITVSGEIAAKHMGRTLTHEHILVDFIGADSIGFHHWDREVVLKKVLPYVLKAKEAGFKTFIECTPAYLGRDPILLKMLSEKSGMQIITNTGYYAAVNNKFLPSHAYSETAEQIANRWIDESINGIEKSGIKPGFIKISVETNDTLSDLHKKIIRAAIITHKKTKLVIASHTIGARAAFEEIAIISNSGIPLQSFIWVHSQSADVKDQIKAAKYGAWISIDNVNADSSNLSSIADRIKVIKSAGCLDHVLLSHDAGWYDPNKPDGGNFRGFTEIPEFLIPALLKNGITEDEVNLILETNPAKAFSIK